MEEKQFLYRDENGMEMDTDGYGEREEVDTIHYTESATFNKPLIEEEDQD